MRGDALVTRCESLATRRARSWSEVADDGARDAAHQSLVGISFIQLDGDFDGYFLDGGEQHDPHHQNCHL
jgi:hypothetical protein